MVITNSTPASSLISGNNNSAQTSADSTTSSTDPNNPNNLASEQTFLQLFVAQLQNQDPLDPNEQDPTQMVSELAQFSQLEQLVNIGQNVQSIDQTVVAAAGSGASSSTAAAGNGNSGVTGTSGN